MAAFKSGFNLPAALGFHSGVQQDSSVAFLLVLLDPEVEGTTIRRNFGNYLPVGAVQHLRRREYSPVLKLLFPSILNYYFLVSTNYMPLQDMIQVRFTL